MVRDKPSWSLFFCQVQPYTRSGLHLGFCSRGGKIAVYAYQGGQALHAVHYNIYSKISRGGGGAKKTLQVEKKTGIKKRRWVCQEVEFAARLSIGDNC